jgi:TatD DNase family protein
MSPALVDFHCHLDLFPDPVVAVRDAEAAGVYTLTVTTTPKAWPRNYEITKNTRHIRAALGLHPQLVTERANEIDIWERYLPQTRYVGEVGLDAGPKYYRSLNLQKEVFQRILQACDKAGGKILTVHSVRAAKTVLDLIQGNLPTGRGQVVLHWFTGSKSEARRAAELGCYFSVNTAMLRNERGRELVSALPIDRILTETDAPFTKTDQRPSRPSDVTGVVTELAMLHGRMPEDLRDTIAQNLRVLLGPSASIRPL